MSAYNRSDHPCFHAQARVLLADGKATKAACDVKRGDLVFGGNRVLCVLRTECSQGEAELVSLPGGLLVTPWHPVKMMGESEWVFPADIAAPQVLLCQAVFSFLVEKNETASSRHNSNDNNINSSTNNFASEMTINGWTCATLAHGVTDDAVLGHPFFGTGAVVHALQACKGWEQGLVCLSRPLSSSSVLRRDERTGLVCGF